MNIPEHPEVARCLATGYPQPLTDEASAGATRRVDNFEDRQESGLLDE